MRAENLIRYLLGGLTAGAIALSGAGHAQATPVLSTTVAVKAAVSDHVAPVGYYYRDYAGAWVNGPVAVGFLWGTAVTPFYAPPAYPPYVYAAPPVYYTPPLYYGPAVVYGRPVLAADPYYPSFYPYIRSTGYGGYWRRGHRPYGRY
jgi:hypothetical protein